MISALPLAASDILKLGVDDVLSPYVYVFYAAFVVSFLFTPVMRTVATYYGIVDKPDGLRKIHREPIAYLGGVAIFLGWLAGLAVTRFLVLHHGAPPSISEAVSQVTNGLANPTTLPFVGNISPRLPLTIVASGIIIMLLGLIDDVRGISPKVKIGGQILAAVLIAMQGVGTHVTKPLLGNLNERMQIWFHGNTIDAPVYIREWMIVATSVPLVIAFVVFCCNAANLMDGVDGLCGGVTGIIAIGYVFLAVHIAQAGAAPQPDALRIIIALALLGGVLGFVPFNFNPASIFMGDTGSMFMGFAMAVLMLLMGEVASKWLLAATVMFALPTLDTCLAFVRRGLAGRRFFSADKHHIHHQFLARGLSVKQTVLFLYASAIGFALLGASIAFMRTRYAVAVYLVIFGYIAVAAYKMGMVHERVKSVDKRNPIGPDDTASNTQPGGTLELPNRSPTINSEPPPSPPDNGPKAG